MTDIPTLIQKLEAADGPSRELDAEIAEAAQSVGVDWPNPRLDIRPITAYEDRLSTGAGMMTPPMFTRFLDAALALVEERLGSRSCILEVGDTDTLAGIGRAGLYFTRHKSPAIALLIALLRALQAQGGDHD